MSGVDLWLKVNDLNDKMLNAVDDFTVFSKDAAQKNALYKKERSKRLMVRRAEGVPVSILKEVVDGEDDIADLKCDADATDGLRDSTREYIMALKVAITTLREQIQREWNL